MKTKETTQTSVLTKRDINSYFFDGYKLVRINIYDPATGATLIDIPRGWFGYSNNDYPEIHFPFSIIKKMKSDQTRNFAHIVTEKEKYRLDNTHTVALFLPVTLLNLFTIEKNLFDFETDTDKHYYDNAKFTVTAVKTDCTYNKKYQRLEYHQTKPKPFEINIRFNLTQRPTQHGLNVEMMKTEFNKNKWLADLSESQISELLKNYILTPIN